MLHDVQFLPIFQVRPTFRHTNYPNLLGAKAVAKEEDTNTINTKFRMTSYAISNPLWVAAAAASAGFAFCS
jgi:hypothetical protein